MEGSRNIICKIHCIKISQKRDFRKVNYQRFGQLVHMLSRLTKAAFKSVSTSPVPDHKISKNGLDRSEYWESHGIDLNGVTSF